MNLQTTSADGQQLYRISYMLVNFRHSIHREAVTEYHWSHSLTDAAIYARRNTTKFGCDYYRLVAAAC